MGSWGRSQMKMKWKAKVQLRQLCRKEGTAGNRNTGSKPRSGGWRNLWERQGRGWEGILPKSESANWICCCHRGLHVSLWPHELREQQGPPRQTFAWGEHFPPALQHREQSLKPVPLPLQPFSARDVCESSREEEQLLPGDGLHKDLLKVGDVV